MLRFLKNATQARPEVADNEPLPVVDAAAAAASSAIGTTADVPAAGESYEDATARTGISLWKRIVNKLIDLKSVLGLTTDTPLAGEGAEDGTARTHTSLLKRTVNKLIDLKNGIGLAADAAVITDTTGTISGKLRGLVKWAFERMPASLGQKAMTASLPVVVASDQSNVPVSQATHDSLNANVNLQKGDADVSASNPVDTAGRRVPTYQAANVRTVTTLDSLWVPKNNAAELPAAGGVWFPNPGGYERLRAWIKVGIRGTEGHLDPASVVATPYLRGGGAAGSVGMCDSVVGDRQRVQGDANLRFLLTADNGATFTSYTTEVTDNDRTTVAILDNLSTLVAGDWFYIVSPTPLTGVDFDVLFPNTNASVMAVHRWNGSAEVAVNNLVDGTILVAGQTLGRSGQVTWGLHTDEMARTVAVGLAEETTGYTYRFTFDSALDAQVEIASADALLPVEIAVDVQANGGDVAVMLSNWGPGAPIDGTRAINGTITPEWS